MDSIYTLIKSINPSLLPNPPPKYEESENDLCFYGPNGEQGAEHLVYCKDLEVGRRAMLASWYLSPQRHLEEFVLWFFVMSFILYKTWSKLKPKRHQGGSEKIVKPSFPLQVTILIFSTLMIVYKIAGYTGKIYLCLAMPCNVSWILLTTLAFFPGLSPKISNIIAQQLIPFAGFTLVALVIPDISDLSLPFEVFYFFANHYILMIFPFYFLFSGQITTLPQGNETFMENYLTSVFSSWALFGFLMAVIATPLGLYVGMNLNYMLSPPPPVIDLGLDGPYYREVSGFAALLLFFLMRAFFVVTEISFKRFFGPTNVTNKSD